jgi:hypothetical protein
MSVLLLHSRTAWNDYFPATNPTNLNSQTYTSRQTPSSTSVYVLDCFFNYITSTSEVGALCCSSSVTYLLVEFSSFFSCKTSGSYGGAIHFSNTNNGQCVLHGVCGYDCCTASSYYCQFAYIQVNNVVSSKNYVNYSSFTRVVNVVTNADHTLGLFNGKVCCQSINSSMNNCYCVSGICCQPLSVSNSVTCSLIYSSFADNKDANWISIYLYSSGANFEIKNCNIIRNSQVHTSSYGLFYTTGNVRIENSCILENKAPYIFYQASSYTITVSNCTLDKTTKYGKLLIQNTVTKSFILALSHISTRNCRAEYDAIGLLTPITPPPPPSQSSSNEQKLYYTCQRLFHQFPLSSILIYSFINMYAFGYHW